MCDKLVIINWTNKKEKERIQIMPRRLFDKSFRISAVKLIVEVGFSVKEVSRELCVHVNSFYR